jgi:hypothetical protein
MNVMRIALALAVATLCSCQSARVLTNRCESPFVAGSATLSDERSGTVRRYELAGEGGRVGSPSFDLVQAALLEGSAAQDTGITWALTSPAGVRLVVTHRARLQAGEVLTVSGAPGRRDWGLGLPPAPGSAAVALIVPDDQPAELSGTIRVLRVAPLELGVELNVGTARRVMGTVRFRRASAERPCFS